MKFMKILIVTLLVMTMAGPSLAEDRIVLSGSLQVRGHYYSVDRESDDGQSDAAESSASVHPRREEPTTVVEEQAAPRPEEGRAPHVEIFKSGKD